MSKDDSLSPRAWHGFWLLMAGSNSPNSLLWMPHVGLELRLSAVTTG